METVVHIRQTVATRLSTTLTIILNPSRAHLLQLERLNGTLLEVWSAVGHRLLPTQHDMNDGAAPPTPKTLKELTSQPLPYPRDGRNDGESDDNDPEPRSSSEPETQEPPPQVALTQADLESVAVLFRDQRFTESRKLYSEREEIGKTENPKTTVMQK